MKEADFKRKRLNLVLLLDISGSMGSPFDGGPPAQWRTQLTLFACDRVTVDLPGAALQNCTAHDYRVLLYSCM